MDKAILLCVLIFITCLEWQISDATICKPLSKFKIDCNTCFCSRDGSRYACTRKTCRGEPSEFQFINDEAYDDSAIPRNFNEKEGKIPYINDEIPSSREDWDDGRIEDTIPEDYLVPLRNEIDDPRFDQRIQDVGSDDQDVEDNNVLPDDYRFKRDIFI